MYNKNVKFLNKLSSTKWLFQVVINHHFSKATFGLPHKPVPKSSNLDHTIYGASDINFSSSNFSRHKRRGFSFFLRMRVPSLDHQFCVLYQRKQYIVEVIWFVRVYKYLRFILLTAFKLIFRYEGLLDTHPKKKKRNWNRSSLKLKFFDSSKLNSYY